MSKTNKTAPTLEAEPASVVPSTAERNLVIERREGWWFPEPGREAILTALDQEANAPLRLRERGIAIVAESNSGKSALLSRYVQLHPRSQEPGREIIPCIVVDMSRLTRVQDLSVELLTQLGDADPGAGNHTERLRRFVTLSRKVGLQLTFLDEFHEAADTTGKGKPFLKCIKSLMNVHVRVVPVGVDILETVFRRDPQLSSRFQFRRGKLGRITDPGIVMSLMMNISGLSEAEMNSEAVWYVYKETKGIVGHVCDLTENTLTASGALTVENLMAQRALMDCLDDLKDQDKLV